MPRTAKTRYRQAWIAEEEQKVLDLRRQGYSFKEIGTTLGISSQQAERRHRRALEKIRDNELQTAEAPADTVRLHSERLEMLFKELWESVAGDPQNPKSPDPKRLPRVVEVILKVMERQAKLLGLDAPDKVQQLNANLDLNQLSVQELREEAAKLGLLTSLPEIPLLLPGEESPGTSLPLLEASFEVHPASLDSPPALPPGGGAGPGSGPRRG